MKLVQPCPKPGEGKTEPAGTGRTYREPRERGQEAPGWALARRAYSAKVAFSTTNARSDSARRREAAPAKAGIPRRHFPTIPPLVFHEQL